MKINVSNNYPELVATIVREAGELWSSNRPNSGSSRLVLKPLIKFWFFVFIWIYTLPHLFYTILKMKFTCINFWLKPQWPLSFFKKHLGSKITNQCFSKEHKPRKVPFPFLSFTFNFCCSAKHILTHIKWDIDYLISIYNLPGFNHQKIILNKEDIL